MRCPIPGDAYLGQLASEITHASFWAKGNNAIAITYDNGDNSAGCCDANPGGGQIATIVVTSHGPRGLKDNSPANHYSLLSSIEHVLGLGCLQFTCDAKHVQPLTPMFAVTGTKAMLAVLAQDAPAVASADVIAGAVVWVTGLASVVLIFTPAANPYYRPQPVER
jgi:hypothetical protein